MLTRMHTVFVVAVAALSASTASAGEISTIAGNGSLDYTGDGGPATAASLHNPRGIDIAPDGTIYFADASNFVIRKIDTSGIITTVAGSGTYGDGGDGGDALDALFSEVLAIALDPTGTLLYVADISNGRVRRVNLTTGIIEAVVDVAFPQGIAVDAAGNVYVSETLFCAVRLIDGDSGTMTTYAGNGTCDTLGNGGSALAASFAFPTRLSLDSSGNLFVVDSVSNTVRRIDAATGIVTRVAGGGMTVPGFGPATDMDLLLVTDVAVGGPGALFVSNETQVFRIDQSTGLLSVYAGTGLADFSGDGGPATECSLNGIDGIVNEDSTGRLLIADSFNARIRQVLPDAPPGLDLVIELTTTQEFLDAVTAVEGNVLMVDVDGREFLVIPNLATVGVDVTAQGNDDVVIIDLSALQTLGGSISINGNLSLTTLDLSSLVTVGDSVNIADNPELSAVLIGGGTSIGGDLTVIGTAATVIDLASLTTVGGNISINDNDAATVVDLSGLETVGGNVGIDDNDGATVIDLNNLDTAANVSVTDNDGATVVDLSSLETVGGDLDVTDNGASTVNLDNLVSVTGNMTIDSTGSGTFDATACAGGSTDIDASGYAAVLAATAEGSTSVTSSDDSTVSVDLLDGTFSDCVNFSLTRVLVSPEGGTDADGNPAIVDAIDAYQVTFDVPTLGVPATLTFDIVMASLEPARQIEVLEALNTGILTLVTKSGDAGSTFQSFPVCASGVDPTVDGCVAIETLDANGAPTSGTPAIVRFTGVVGHFSIRGPAIVTPLDEQCPVTSPAGDIVFCSGFESPSGQQ